MDRWLNSGSINNTPAIESSCSTRPIKKGSIIDEDGIHNNILTIQGKSRTGDFMSYRTWPILLLNIKRYKYI